MLLQSLEAVDSMLEAAEAAADDCSNNQCVRSKAKEAPAVGTNRE